MKKFNVSNALFAMLFLGFIAFGCNENDDPITPATEAPATPTGLKATAKSATEIILKWDAPSATATPKAVGYELTVTPGSATPISITTTATTYTIGGLTEGTTYTFSLKAKSADSKTSNAATVKWAPARRSGVLKLYSSKSTTFGSGLDLDGDGGNPKVLKIAEGDKWDIAFDDKITGEETIIAPGQSLYVDDSFKFPNGKEAKKTLVSTLRYTNAASFDDIFESTMLDAGTKEQGHLLNTANSFAFVVKTAEGNYAKVLVIARGGNIIQGSGNDTYIEVQVSYQSTPNVPYALPGRTDNNIVKSETDRKSVV